MKRSLLVVAVLIPSVSLFLTVGAERAGAQGPAGAGASFVALHDCLAVLHASHNLGLEFNCLSASVTGVHTSADLSGCKLADGEKALSLNKAIHQLKPDANAKEATKNAEQQATDDLKDLGA